MLQTFARLLLPNEDEVNAIEKAALVINIRERHFLADFPDELEKLKRKKLNPYCRLFRGFGTGTARALFRDSASASGR